VGEADAGLGAREAVVAADVFNLAELAGDAGIIVPAGNARAMAAALDQVVGDATVATRLTHAAAERAPMFTVAYHVERCLDVYRRVIGR
jgi:glycosyltransferase involved in cell wall biosynthesis